VNHLSPLAWVGIGLICAVIIVMNIGLVAFLRFKPKLDRKLPRTQDGLQMNRMIEVIKDPFGEERKQLNTLSDLVEQIKKADREE
jgi:hypothetical protein